MARRRIIVGSTGQQDTARRAARQLLDQGHEVVFVGGEQTPEQLLRAAIAEDAAQIVVVGEEGVARRLRALCDELGSEAPEVSHREPTVV